MGYRKENKFAFDEARKESFTSRLKLVIGSRSVRAAAKDWGLSFSTLNNYLTRGTEPSFVAMQAIASAEGISLDWLAFGGSDSNMNQPAVSVDKKSHDEPAQEQETAGKLTSAWLAVLDSLDEGEAQALLRIIHKKGVDGIVELATANSLDMELLQLPTDEKERLMALHEAKKGASDDSQKNELTHPTHKAG